LYIRPLLFNFLVYETGDRIFVKIEKKIKIDFAVFIFADGRKIASTKNKIETEFRAINDIGNFRRHGHQRM
jgi:hypothetical protein